MVENGTRVMVGGKGKEGGVWRSAWKGSWRDEMETRLHRCGSAHDLGRLLGRPATEISDAKVPDDKLHAW